MDNTNQGSEKLVLQENVHTKQLLNPTVLYNGIKFKLGTSCVQYFLHLDYNEMAKLNVVENGTKWHSKYA